MALLVGMRVIAAGAVVPVLEAALLISIVAIPIEAIVPVHGGTVLPLGHRGLAGVEPIDSD